MRLCGGDAAARETRRCGLALLALADGEPFEQTDAARQLYADARELKVHARMIRTGFNSPWTSSTGRLFDGIAALLGLCARNDHEAQAAMAVESAAFFAARQGAHAHMDAFQQISDLFEVRHDAESGLWELDVSPLVRCLVQAAPSSSLAEVHGLARLAHKTLAEGWAALAVAARPAAMGSHAGILGASGGTFCNQVLSRDLAASARDAGLRVLFHETYPPTDAGLGFGQAIYSTHSS
jgi:hydrogenase maturation protein HypF